MSNIRPGGDGKFGGWVLVGLAVVFHGSGLVIEANRRFGSEKSASEPKTELRATNPVVEPKPVSTNPAPHI